MNRIEDALERARERDVEITITTFPNRIDAKATVVRDGFRFQQIDALPWSRAAELPLLIDTVTNRVVKVVGQLGRS